MNQIFVKDSNGDILMFRTNTSADGFLSWLNALGVTGRELTEAEYTECMEDDGLSDLVTDFGTVTLTT